MNIYIESKDGAFHDITDAGWERARYYTGGAVYGYFSDCSRRTEGRDFEVGSRVYFQSAGWTEVVERKGVCKECFWAGPTAENCPDMACADRERRDGKAIEFRPIEQNDDINHPSHYTDGPVCPHCGKPIECITITERMSFTIGNAVKYLWRAGKKKDNTYVKDLKKAAWYVNREIERESK